MKLPLNKKTSVFTVCCVLLSMLCGCESGADDKSNSETAVANKSAEASPSFPCLNVPKINYDVPGDTPITSQEGLNCFAWQVFIGLNWQVDANKPGYPDISVPAADFGVPGTEQTGVWETYANAENVMRPNAQAPLLWGQSAPLPAACQQAGAITGGAVRIMHASRISGDFNLAKDVAQAFPADNPNWLADKNGNLVYYEILMGEDEYNFINDNKLYNADIQAQFLKANNNIALPLGHDSILGGLELKAAWLTVGDPQNAKWKRFKTTKAWIYDEYADTCEQSVMALVGLHIIHKTASQPQWVWATFEHVDNAPDRSAIGADGTVAGDYTFYNNSCSEQRLPTACKAKLVNGSPVSSTSCEANVSPAYYLDGTSQCPPYPVRVAREFEIKDTTSNRVASLNSAVKASILAANSNSVFANYMLVNLLWSSAAINDNVPPGNPPLTPLSVSGETPSLNTVPVANTMLETYAQGFNCLSCHAYASVPMSVQKMLDGKSYASDYSFIFGLAEQPQ